ncbi:uncharacterized protein N7511_004716 [Penicillium nucicola]|uniref:uncharacterized protein n=1 Tax=Penicillium nucicola TaxID=1850975 RepID=UPI0025459E54|nr:uncharacterized protein N7511_004716 [Penicillium nucicola]KAJ5767100.1 hypothetical protein N7511_004716 [Penicillium nucicola]
MSERELHHLKHTVPHKGQPRLYVPNTLWTRAFSITVIAETVATCAIESWILISLRHHLDDDGKDNANMRLQSFLGLYIFALLYELALSYDALRRKNTIQLVGLCICNLGLLTYGFLQMQEIKSTVRTALNDQAVSDQLLHTFRIEIVLVPIILGVCTIAMTFFTWKLRAEFSWSIYKNISADLQMKRRYLTYQVYIALLKFDFFFVFGSQLQIILVVLKYTDSDFILNASLIPITIATLVGAAQFCKREKKKSLITMMFFMLVIMGIFGLTLYRMHLRSQSQQFASVRVSLTLFSSISLFLMGVTLVISVLCILNFNKGLKVHVMTPPKRRKGSVSLELQAQDIPSRYLEQLLRDSEELHDRNRNLKEMRLDRSEQTSDSRSSPDTAEENAGSIAQSHLIRNKPWFQSHDASMLPLYISEATCTAFATRLCQFFQNTKTPMPHFPRSHYTDESTITSLLNEWTGWPSLVCAQLLVKTALGHIMSSFHFVLKKDTMDMLQNVYQTQNFENESIKCKFFALFAIGQVYSTVNGSFDEPHVPGLDYFAKALSLVQVIPERPTMIHIESLLLLAFFCQFLNRFHSAYLFIGNALRLALSMGLNYNVPQSQNLHLVAREHRIRIWWCIYTLDRFWGSKSGFPVQIHDEWIHVDLPSSLASETYPDQFADSAFPITAIELAKITGNTTGYIYCQKQSVESFLHSEQKLLTQLKQLVQSLPEQMKLHPNTSNPKDVIQMHLQFNFCVILAIRPVLLHVLKLTKKGRSHQFNDTISPVLVTLSEACIHSARHSFALCLDEWTEGSFAIYGYAFPAYLFSAALVLIVARLLPLGIPADLTAPETALEILKNLSLSGNLASRDLYDHLIRVQMCANKHPVYPSLVLDHYENEPINPSPMDDELLPTSSRPRRFSDHPHTSPYLDDLNTQLSESNVPFLTTEMALHQPTMLDFLTQSHLDFGLLDPVETFNDFDLAFSRSSD